MTLRTSEPRGAAYSPTASRELSGAPGHPGVGLRAIGALAVALVVALVVALRVVLLDTYPASADEGGWPLSARRLVEDGQRTFDFYKAPGFHWLLAGPFALFGATIGVARASAAVAGLVGLFFFHRIALRTLASPRQALVATLLLGTSFAAVMTDRRALIEPFLVPWMLAVAFFAIRRGPRDAWWIAFSTAGLLLTKASGLFLLPVLGLMALVGDGSAHADDPGPAGSRRVLVGLAGGVVLAVVVFGGLYLADPHTFLEGWVPTLASATRSAAAAPHTDVPHVGRFGIDPQKVVEWMTGLARDEPFLFAFGLAGAVRGLVEGRQRTMALWLLAGMAFLLLQTYVLENHLAVLFAPMALLTAWMLGDLDRNAPERRLGRVTLRWPHAVGAMIVLFGVVRIAGAVALKRDETRAVTGWLAQRVAPGDHLVGAPYLLMRLRTPGTEFAALPAPYLPLRARLDSLGADWVVVDGREWRGHAASLGGDAAAFDAALAACCDAVHESPGVTVFRVRHAPR